MILNLDLTERQVKLLQENLDHDWRTSVNHLVSSVEATVANPQGDWAQSAPRIAEDVETNRMLILKIERAVAAETNPEAASNGPVQHPNLADFPPKQDPATACISFTVRMHVEVDLDTEKPTACYVLTPNVSTMDQADGLNIEFWRQGVSTDIDPSSGAGKLVLKVLDDNEWPSPELQS